MSLGSNEDLIYNEKIRRTSEGHVSELTQRYLHNSSSPEEFRKEITKMSEKKAKELFVTEEERTTWIDSIRKSVEQNLQTQVRAVLGTPDAKRKRPRVKPGVKLQEGSQNSYNNSYKDHILNPKENSYSLLKDNEDRLKFDRDKRRYNLTQESSSRVAPSDPSLSDEFSKDFSPYTRAALENVVFSTSTNTSHQTGEQTYKRAPGGVWVDSQGAEHELPGPFWPKDHLPVFSHQKHIHTIPNFAEYLNITGTRGVLKEEDPAIFPKPWKGTALVYDRSNFELSPTAPTGCFPNLKFESRFECGNLHQAKRVGRYEYDLVLTTDLYTKCHTQWYYFHVENMMSGVTYKFNIVNLLKKDSLYNYGMKPLLYSQKQSDINNIGWRRAGHSITYSRSSSPKNPHLTKELTYYVLSFQMEFPSTNDVCYLAHCYPYSYSDLELYLRTLVDSPTTSQHVRKEVLCKTLAGNNCHVLTVTSSQVPDNKKLGVVISARVHPGETNASWMMKGVMDYLTSSDAVAESLRRKFVFKIVPMLNPDGVIVGNYRTNLAAKDLNRTFKEPHKANFPTVWHTKAMLESFKEQHEVIIYCDLHGHSRKPNVFMYGCTADPSMDSVTNFLEERLFPWMMSQKAPDKFSFQGCKFIVRKCKESTARVVMWRQLGIMNSFTMEATFCGTNFGDMEKGRHFNTHDFEDMGRHFCEVLLEYSEAKSANRNEMTQAFVQLACKMTRDILKQSLGSFKRPSEGDKHLTRSNDNKLNENTENFERGNLQFLNSTKHGLKITPTPRDVNFVDVDVQRASNKNSNEVGKNGGDYEVAVKSIHVDSFNDCIKILEGLRLTKCYQESDSSDSDSDPEDEICTKKELKRRKRKKKRKQNWWENLSKTGASDTSPSKDKVVVEEEQVKLEERKVKTSFGKFVNPYSNRSNNGIPVYSQERILERAKKKEMEKESEEKERAEVQQTTDVSSSGESVIALTDDTELNFVTAQRRLTYYMMNRQHQNKPNCYVRSTSHPNLTVVPSNSVPSNSVPSNSVPSNSAEGPNIDSFKMDHLDGGGYGFTMKFRANRNTEHNRREILREGQRNARPASLQSFEEARSIDDSPAFVEFEPWGVFPPKGVAEKRARNAPKVVQRSRDNVPYSDYAKKNETNSTKDLETMLRLVNGNSGRKSIDFERKCKDDLLAEFRKLNVRAGRRRQPRVVQGAPSTSHEGPSLNNRSTVDLRTPMFPSYDDAKWSEDSHESGSPRFESLISIPSYSSVGISSPATSRRQPYD